MNLQPSILQHTAAWIKVVPLLLGLVALRSRWTPALRWFLLWCLLLLVQSALSRSLGLRGINNMWVSYTFLPLTTTVALLALAEWQDRGTGRLALRLTIPLVVFTSIVLTLAIENTGRFSLIAAPFHSLVLLIAALWTFVHRSQRAEEALPTHDWFWILAGIILYAGTSAAVQPLGWFLLGRNRLDLVRAVWSTAAAAWVVAFLAMAVGVACRIPQISSGGSSSRRFSPSA